MSGYTERDTAKDTKVPKREVEAAWHQARDDSGVRGNGTGDRPTPENRAQARALERKIMDRARSRPPERSEDSRGER
jgi:hypothetical protein